MTTSYSRFIANVLGFAVALGLHAAAYIGIMSNRSQHGLKESEIASVSMNLLESRILEDVVQGDAQDRRASDLDQAASTAGTSDQTLPEPPKEREKETPKPPEPAPRKTQAEKQKAPQDTGAEKPEETVRPPEPTETKQEEKPQSATKQSAKSSAASRASEATRKGADKGQVNGPQATSAGSQKASPGKIRAYAGLVNARIARRRPSGRGRRGTVSVSFAIGSGGALRFARIVRSSGNKSLDAAALNAVRRAAPFPKPPVGMTPQQLSFVMPFRFR